MWLNNYGDQTLVSPSSPSYPQGNDLASLRNYGPTLRWFVSLFYSLHVFLQPPVRCKLTKNEAPNSVLFLGFVLERLVLGLAFSGLTVGESRVGEERTRSQGGGRKLLAPYRSLRWGCICYEWNKPTPRWFLFSIKTTSTEELHKWQAM